MCRPRKRKKRILFVDSDAFVLSALRRSLRCRDMEWQLAFAASVDSALAAMEANPAQVLVSGITLPGEGGIAFLEAIERNHPATARVILSGVCMYDEVARAQRVAHLYVTKPWSKNQLTQIVRSALALHDLLCLSGLPGALTRVAVSEAQWPEWPRQHAAIVERMHSANGITVRELASMIEQNPDMAQRLLNIVNSGLLGATPLRGKLEHAIRVFGINALSSLVLAMEIFAATGNADEERHALLSAALAASMAGRDAAEYAFTAALLHDVGLLYWPDHEPECTTGDGAIGHAELGAYLLATWGMPAPVIEAMAHHHHPMRNLDAERAQERDCAMVARAAVHVADGLANENRGRSPVIEQAAVDTLQFGGDLSSWRELTADLGARYDAKNSKNSRHSGSNSRRVTRPK